MAAHPSATGTGAWFFVGNGTGGSDYLACQVSSMGTNAVAIQASLDNSNGDELLVFAADKKIVTIPVTPGVSYRAVVNSYVSGSPVVKCTVTGTAQIVVIAP